MLTEAAVEVHVARGHHVEVQLRVPDDARGVVAILGDDAPLAAACNNSGLAVASCEAPVEADPLETGKLAAVFADAISAVTDDQALRDRPVGYFGQGVNGAATLLAASLHTDEVTAVVALDAPLTLVGASLSGVRAPILLMVDPVNEGLVDRTRDALPALPNTSLELQLTADAGAAAQWFDRYLRGIARGKRREQWQLLQ